MIKIEQGKYYRTREGRKVGPAVYTPAGGSGITDWCIPCEHGPLYYSGEGVICLPEMESDYNIVGEWTEGDTKVTLQIEEGKYYKSRAGKKIGPMVRDNEGEWPWTEYGGYLTYRNDGTQALYKYEPNANDLIEEWQDGPKTFGEMTDAEQGALLLAEYRGEDLEFASSDGNWFTKHSNRIFYSHYFYRVRQQPEVKWVTVDNPHDPDYQITYKKVDGKVDTGSVTMGYVPF